MEDFELAADVTRGIHLRRVMTKRSWVRLDVKHWRHSENIYRLYFGLCNIWTFSSFTSSLGGRKQRVLSSQSKCQCFCLCNAESQRNLEVNKRRRFSNLCVRFSWLFKNETTRMGKVSYRLVLLSVWCVLCSFLFLTLQLSFYFIHFCFNFVYTYILESNQCFKPCAKHFFKKRFWFDVNKHCKLQSFVYTKIVYVLQKHELR